MIQTQTRPKTKPDESGRRGVTASNGHLLLAPDQAVELMSLFKVLANDTRLRILHSLACHGELGVTGLADALGMGPSAVCNQLRGLLYRGIVASRRQGNNVYYRIVNPCVTDLLDRGLCLVENSCGES